MKIFYAIADCGDGSGVVNFFLPQDEEYAQDLLDEDEAYYASEGQLRYFTIPDDLDPFTLGIHFYAAKRNQ